MSLSSTPSIAGHATCVCTTEALQRLIDARVGFASVTEDIDFNTAIGRVMMALLAAFAEFFSSQLGEHVKKAVKQRAAQGLQNGSAPFGYLRDDETGIPCPVPEEAEAVRTVFAKRAAGETSGKIAVWLNAAGFRTRRGNTFTDGSVRDMLGFRFYLGVVRLGDEEFPGQHEGIIAPELFERVQTRTVKRGPALHTAGGGAGVACRHHPVWPLWGPAAGRPEQLRKPPVPRAPRLRVQNGRRARRPRVQDGREVARGVAHRCADGRHLRLPRTPTGLEAEDRASVG